MKNSKKIVLMAIVSVFTLLMVGNAHAEINLCDWVAQPEQYSQCKKTKHPEPPTKYLPTPPGGGYEACVMPYGCRGSHKPWPKPLPVPPVYNPMPPAHSGTTWEEYRECMRMRTVTNYGGATPPCKKPMVEYDTTDHGSHEHGKFCRVKVQVQCVKAPCLPQWKRVPCDHANNGHPHNPHRVWNHDRTHNHSRSQAN
jgi:hypothetical protein